MLKVNLKSSDNYIGADFDKLNRSLALLETAINSDSFRITVLNFQSFEFVRYKCVGSIQLRTVHLTEYSNDNLYSFLMKGHRQEGDDSFMDLQLKLSDDGGGSAIGETDGDDVTTTYRAAFNGMAEGELAAHYTHEWTHTMGFEHSFSNKCDSKRDCLSVPYAIGNIIEIILTGKCWYGCRYKTLNE